MRSLTMEDLNPIRRQIEREREESVRRERALRASINGAEQARQELLADFETWADTVDAYLADLDTYLAERFALIDEALEDLGALRIPPTPPTPPIRGVADD